MAQKILVVTQDNLIEEILQRKLKEAGHEVLIDRSGKQALQNVDLVILDGDMQKVLSLQEIAGKSKILLLLNSNQPQEIALSQSLKAKGHIFKAEFDIEQIVLKVSDILKQK